MIKTIEDFAFDLRNPLILLILNYLSYNKSDRPKLIHITPDTSALI